VFGVVGGRGWVLQKLSSCLTAELGYGGEYILGCLALCCEYVGKMWFMGTGGGLRGRYGDCEHW